MDDKDDYSKSIAGKRRFNNPELYQKSLDFQNLLQANGIAWHNSFADECTNDFGCCTNIGEYKDRIPSCKYG